MTPISRTLRYAFERFWPVCLSCQLSYARLPHRSSRAPSTMFRALSSCCPLCQYSHSKNWGVLVLASRL